MAYLNLTFKINLICIHLAWGQCYNFFFVFFLLLSLMKNSELPTALRCVGPIPLTLFMSNNSAVLVCVCVCFFRSWKLGNKYQQVAWQRSQVDLLSVRRCICTLIWKRTHNSWCPAIHCAIKVLGQKHSIEKTDIPSLVPSLTKPSSIMKRKSSSISNPPSALYKDTRHSASITEA